MTRRIRSRLFVVMVVAALAGGAWFGYRWTQPKVVTVEGAYVLVSGYQSGSGDAKTDGELALVAGRCLGIKQVGGRDWLVIWPHGTKVEREPKLSVVADGVKIGLGDAVEIGGESGGVGLTPKDYHYDKIPQACRALSVWNGSSVSR